MSVAAILRRHGFSPQSPQPVPNAGDAETIVAQGVPKVPAVPSKNDKGKLRTHLLTLAHHAGIDARQVHRLTDADVAACEGVDEEPLRAWLKALPSITKREAGRIPHDYTARAVCDGCGAVAVHPGTIESAPVAEGWPRLTSCPWCLYRLRTGKHPPRPVATCGDCRHWQPDPLNPDAGVGRCKAGVTGLRWPIQPHRCDNFILKGRKPE